MLAKVAQFLRSLKRKMKSRTLATPTNGVPAHRRMLSDKPQRYVEYIQAARDYVEKSQAEPWLYTKPYDRSHGNPEVYKGLYQILNILEAMRLPVQGRVLEVGSGPGWVTEILMLLGYEVDGIEPCEDMIRVAEYRIKACIEHHRLERPSKVQFHQQPLEECELPDEAFDGVLFHESLHHVVDEEKGLANVYRMLKPGRMLGVSGEPSWKPGNREFEEPLEEEMRLHGTLENPFTTQYLFHLLGKYGFVGIERYHGVNGLVRVQDGHLTAEKLARFPGYDNHIVTAFKQYPCVTTIDLQAKTQARMRLRDTQFDPATNKAWFKLELTNIGETLWLHGRDAGSEGVVMLALRQGVHTDANFREVFPRKRLRAPVEPGETIVFEAEFVLPNDHQGEWFLDLVNEHLFWFSQRGTTPLTISFRDGRVSKAA